MNWKATALSLFAPFALTGCIAPTTISGSADSADSMQAELTSVQNVTVDGAIGVTGSSDTQVVIQGSGVAGAVSQTENGVDQALKVTFSTAIDSLGCVEKARTALAQGVQLSITGEGTLEIAPSGIVTTLVGGSSSSGILTLQLDKITDCEIQSVPQPSPSSTPVSEPSSKPSPASGEAGAGATVTSQSSATLL